MSMIFQALTSSILCKQSVLSLNKKLPCSMKKEPSPSRNHSEYSFILSDRALHSGANFQKVLTTRPFWVNFWCFPRVFYETCFHASVFFRDGWSRDAWTFCLLTLQFSSVYQIDYTTFPVCTCVFSDTRAIHHRPAITCSTFTIQNAIRDDA